jgi:hypothetical protein
MAAVPASLEESKSVIQLIRDHQDNIAVAAQQMSGLQQNGSPGGAGDQIPTVLRHKYQQLKDPKKYAQMIYLSYNPPA